MSPDSEDFATRVASFCLLSCLIIVVTLGIVALLTFWWKAGQYCLTHGCP